MSFWIISSLQVSRPQVLGLPLHSPLLLLLYFFLRGSLFLPGEFHGQRTLVGYSPWGRKESDMTEQLTPSLYFLLIYFWLRWVLVLAHGLSYPVGCGILVP